MSRHASPLAEAVRALCEKTNFSLKHAAARPELAKMGIALAPEPPEKSEAYSQWAKAVAEFKIKRPKTEDELRAWFKETVKAAGLPANSVEAIMAEDAPHYAFHCERNTYNVTKFNHQNKLGFTVSEKPQPTKKAPRAAKVAPVKVAAKVAPVKVDSKVASLASDVEAIQWLLANGGFSAVQNTIAEMTNKLKEATAAWKRLSNKAA